MSGTAPNFTLTCQSLSCTVSADKPAPLPTDSVVLTASCAGAGGLATYTWSKFGGPGTCPAISGSTANATVSAPGSTQNGCIYRVAVSDPTSGGGSANITLNFTSTPPASPAGCSIAFTAGSANLASTGGTVAMIASCSQYTNANTTWAWTKNGVALGTGTTANDTLPANTLTTAVSTTYQVTATNAGATPTVTTQVVSVAGTGGGGGSFDLSACTSLGYTGHGVDIAYPAGLGNTPRVLTPNVGSFGNNDMIVVRFVAPTSEVSAGATLTASEYSSYEAVQRLATLSTQPCVVATAPGAFGNVLASAANFPVANLTMRIGPGGFGQINLTPGVTYYVNYVNRIGYTSSGSCSSSNCAMYIDFKN
jgi:hypothetical protein